VKSLGNLFCGLERSVFKQGIAGYHSALVFLLDVFVDFEGKGRKGPLIRRMRGTVLLWGGSH
jgi:hypothetical protein